MRLNFRQWRFQNRRRVLADQAQDARVELSRPVQIVSRPPDHFCIRNRRFQSSAGVSGTQPYHNFLRSNETEAV